MSALGILISLWQLLDRRQRRRLAVLQLVSVLMALSTVGGITAVLPFFTVLADPTAINRTALLRFAYDHFHSSSNRNFVVTLGLGFIAIIVTSNLINLCGSLAMNRFAYRVADRYHLMLFDEYLHRDYLFHSRVNSSALTNKVIHESGRLTGGILRNGLLVVTNGITTVFIVTSVLIIDPFVALTAIGTLALAYSIMYAAVRGRLLRNGVIQSRYYERRIRVVNEGFGAVKEILVSHAQAPFVSRFSECCVALSKAVVSTLAITQSPRYVLESVTLCVLVAVALYLSETRQGTGAWIAQLSFLGLAAYRLMPALQQAFAAIANIRADAPAFESVADDLRQAHAREGATRARAVDHPDGFDTTTDGPVGRCGDGREPAGEKSVGRRRAGREPAGDESVRRHRVGSESAGDGPVCSHRVGRDSAADVPIGCHRDGREPTGDESVGCHREGRDSAGEGPVGRRRAGRDAARDEPVSRDAVGASAGLDRSRRSWPLKQLSVEEVSFFHRAGRVAAIVNVSVRIAAGTTVGFVGANGSGKTTLIDLVAGLLVPQQGRVVVDGVVVDETNRHAWQNNIAYVPQQGFVLDATLSENIALGVPVAQIDKARVRAAVGLARLDECVAGLAAGYDEMLGEGGSRLSGGQRQRLAIARALYRDASVLILDEATSALDGSAEEEVVDMLARLAPKRTVLLIAHRLSALRHCDAVYELRSGRIVRRGSYADFNSGSKLSAVGSDE